MKKILRIILILILISNTVDGKDKTGKYFITNSGTRIDFKSIKKVNDDSVVVKTRKGVSYILVDSISEYHYHTVHGLVVRSFVFGSLIGLGIGYKIGSISPVDSDDNNGGYNYTPPYNEETHKLSGSIIGFTLGGLIGILLGSNEVEHIDRDFSKLNRQEKVVQLSKLSK